MTTPSHESNKSGKQISFANNTMHNTRTTRNSGMYCCCYTHWGTYQQEIRCAVFFLLLSQMQSQEAHASLHEELQPAAVGHKITDKIVLLVLPSQATE